MDRKSQEWHEAMKERGHSPVVDSDGHLDFFAHVHDDYHNGPACAVCGWGTCWHCDKLPDIPRCDNAGTADGGSNRRRNRPTWQSFTS